MIDPGTTIGAVHLTISDLHRSVRFYGAHLGFVVHRQDDRTAWLGAGGPDLLILTQDEHAPRARATTGLYHLAILVPSRADLARSFRLLVQTGSVLQGAADHGVSEALYLADLDGNGIEVYRDRPRADWPQLAGHLQMGVEPLDLETLLSEAGETDSGAGLAPGTVIGHVHLQVSQIAEAEAFYVGILGFELTLRYGRGASFVAAGGYHHHLGLNTWAGVGAPPSPPGALGLRYFVVSLPSDAALAAVVDRVRAAGASVEPFGGGMLIHDPSRNAIVLTTRLG